MCVYIICICVSYVKPSHQPIHMQPENSMFLTWMHTRQHTHSKMSLADDVNLDEFVMTKDDLSGADIKAICTESGLLVSKFPYMMTGRFLWFLCCQRLVFYG
jgi:hypothetical protein